MPMKLCMIHDLNFDGIENDPEQERENAEDKRPELIGFGLGPENRDFCFSCYIAGLNRFDKFTIKDGDFFSEVWRLLHPSVLKLKA